jgi:hypothetical protein
VVTVGIRVARTSRDAEARVAAYQGYVVRIAKQVITTMIASAQEGFADEHPELRQFVLDRESRLPPEKLRLSTYLCSTRTGRSTGLAVAMQAGASPHWMVEVALQPFSYVLSVSGETHYTGPVSIAEWGSYGYDEVATVTVPQIPLLPTHEAFPGDYRTKDEIRRDIALNILVQQGHIDPAGEANRLAESGSLAVFLKEHGEE